MLQDCKPASITESPTRSSGISTTKPPSNVSTNKSRLASIAKLSFKNSMMFSLSTGTKKPDIGALANMSQMKKTTRNLN